MVILHTFNNQRVSWFSPWTPRWRSTSHHAQDISLWYCWLVLSFPNNTPINNPVVFPVELLLSSQVSHEIPIFGGFYHGLSPNIIHIPAKTCKICQPKSIGFPKTMDFPSPISEFPSSPALKDAFTIGPLASSPSKTSRKACRWVFKGTV